MKKLKVQLIFFAVGVLSLGGPYSQLNAATFKWRTQPNVAFAVGEDLVFEIGWKSATAGQVRLSVKEIGLRKNRPAFRLVCEASTNRAIDLVFKVRDRFESWMDTASLCSVGFRRQIEEGSYKKIEDVFVDPVTGQFKSRSTRPDKSTTASVSSGQVPLFVQDVISTLYYVRSLPLRVGGSIQMKVMNGSDVHNVQFNVLRKENVRTKGGEFSCVVLEPLFETEHGFKPHPKATAYIWLTDDTRHLPVKITAELPFGHIDAVLSQDKKP